MAWSDDLYIVSFDAEAGDIASLATAAQKILWFNEAQARLLRLKPAYVDATWTAADRSCGDLTGIRKLDRITYNGGTTPEPWRLWGTDLVLDDPAGASGTGGGRIFYWKDWTAMTTSTTATDLNVSQDYACLYFALSRFYRKLASNRAYYKRYSTLVGQNAVTMTDLQQEADRYYQDFLDAREDVEPDVPAFYYPRY
jgi:hypothetical protein